MDDHLTAAAASWEDGGRAGDWIGLGLGELGPTLGHAVPDGFERYAVIPIPSGDEVPGRQDYRVLGALVDQLAPFTGGQVVHTALWEGWGWLYDRHENPRTAPGSSVFLVGPHSRKDLRWAQKRMARDRVARSNAAPLRLPHRNYLVWAGPLSSSLALRHTGDIPSLIWPDDRSWFIGAPIYTCEIAIGANDHIIRALLDAPTMQALGAHPAERDEILLIDD